MYYSTLSNGGTVAGEITVPGMTMTGSLKLTNIPTDDLEAVNKKYVDDKAANLDAAAVTSGILSVNRMPAMTGDFTHVAGSGVLTLKNSGVTPGTYTKVVINEAGLVVSGGQLTESDLPSISFNKVASGKPSTLAGYGITNAVNRNGGNINGNLLLANHPTLGTDAASKQYVDNYVASLSGYTTGDLISGEYDVSPTGFLRANGGELITSLYTALYAIIGDSFSIGNAMPGAGRPWEQQYYFNNSAAVDFSDWIAAASLPASVQGEVFVTKNRIYIAALRTSSDTSAPATTVYTAPINADGTLGTWTTGPALPAALCFSKALLVKNRVYLFGGVGAGNSRTGVVYYATINADGTLGSWQTGTSLPASLSHVSAALIRNRVYVFGGQNNTPAAVATVYTAPVNSDGSLGGWTSATALPGVKASAAVAVIRDRVYVFGGWTASGVATTGVHYAPIYGDGTLGAWVASTSLPVATLGQAVFVTKNRVHLLGGVTASGSIQTAIYADINADGSLSTWASGASLPGVFGYVSAAALNGALYLLAAAGAGNPGAPAATVYKATLAGASNDYSPYYDGTVSAQDVTLMPGNGRAWEQQFQINTVQTADFSSWVYQSALPIALNASCVVTKNRIYLVGVRDGGNTSATTTYTAVINTDGTLGTWSTGPALPGALGSSTAVTTKNRVYLIGGINGAGADVGVVYSAPINTDGTLGAWGTETALPTAAAGASALVTKNRIYVIGGRSTGGSGAATADVYTAPINPDGSLGAWSTGTSLPAARAWAASAVIGSRLYLFGGYSTATVNLNTVVFAPIYSDGTLGAWQTSTSLPATVHRQAIFVSKNKVYLIGGVTGSAPTGSTAVYYAAINSDHSLGAWTTGTTLPVALGGLGVAAVKDRLYLFGGSDGSVNRDYIYSATLSGTLSDYSSYYDGTVTAPLPATFRLPDLTNSNEITGKWFIKY